MIFSIRLLNWKAKVSSLYTNPLVDENGKRVSCLCIFNNIPCTINNHHCSLSKNGPEYVPKHFLCSVSRTRIVEVDIVALIILASLPSANAYGERRGKDNPAVLSL